MSCPLCCARKGKRACPAVGQKICPVCCGTKRLTEIACPPDCIYLENSQRHPSASVKRQQEHDVGLLAAVLGHVSEGQLQLFFLLHACIANYSPEAMGRVIDADVADAAGALAASLETASRGVFYEHQAQSLPGEALRRELKALIATAAGSGGSRFERQAAEVLRGIERGAKHDVDGIGEGPEAYLTFVGRLLPERPSARVPTSPIISP